jgi:hypothetical protein
MQTSGFTRTVARTSIVIAMMMCVTIGSTVLAAPTPATNDDGDVMVYTAHQGWLSRIYLMDTNGGVLDYFEYEFYYFADVEVIDNELYVAEAFAPRVDRVDLETGELEVIVDDWSLFYFYDVACDGEHIYVTEWDLNRYTLDGEYAGTASFDDDVYGNAWDGARLYTLNDDGLIRCWNVSDWPDLVEIPDNTITAPSPDCRGLWFDGEHFWTAESLDGLLGQIYRFDHEGDVLEQWTEPAFRGWAACLIRGSVTGDLNGDGVVDVADLLALLGHWGPCPSPPAECPADLDDDGSVAVEDLLVLLANWS